MDRRTFIAALASTPIIARHLATAAEGVHLDHIGVQLYTVRSLMAQQGMDAVLSSVAAIGYKEVEFAGYFDNTPKQIRDMLIGNGLTAPSTHVGFESDDDKWKEIVGRSAYIGHTYVTVPGLGMVPHATADDWKRVAALFNKAAAVCKSAGIGFAYHNHQDEFKSVNGHRPEDIMLKECDPDLVKFEMDIAWAIVAGVDPVKYFAANPGRFVLLHVKDLRKKSMKKIQGRNARKAKNPQPIGDEVLADVGSGSIDWKKVLGAANKYGTVHYIVEHDSPADPLLSIRKSFAYLHALTV